MNLSLHGDNATKAGTMQEFFAQMRDAFEAYKTAGYDVAALKYLPVELPGAEFPEARMEVIEKLIDLYIKSLGLLTDLRDKRTILREYASTPGDRVIYFDADDVEDIKEAIRRFADPRDQAFEAALLDRQYGLIAFLGSNVDFAGEYGDPHVAVKYLQKFTRAYMLGSSRVSLSSLPWEKTEGETPLPTTVYRRDVLKARGDAMLAAGYRSKNGKIANELLAKFSKQEKPLQGLMNSVEQMANRLQCSDYQAAQWFNVLFSNISNKVKELTPDQLAAIQELTTEFLTAKSRAELAGMIDVFVQKKLQ